MLDMYSPANSYCPISGIVSVLRAIGPCCVSGMGSNGNTEKVVALKEYLSLPLKLLVSLKYAFLVVFSLLFRLYVYI